MWVEIRYRLVVLALMAMVVGSMAFALRGSVRLGEPVPYDETVLNPYVGAVTAWSRGTAGLGGWVENRSYAACPSVVVWVKADENGSFGLMNQTNGFVAIGPVPARQRIIWAGYRTDAHGRLAPLNSAPRPDPTFSCYR